MMSITRKLTSLSITRTGTTLLRSTNSACSTNTTTNKASKCQPWPESTGVTTPQGQPTSGTHPHLLQSGEVTPGLRVGEFQERRCHLLKSMEEYISKRGLNMKHMVVIPSATKVYMTEKIPYVFRQNSDFLYLSGCLEPDSALVLLGDSNNHESILFLRNKDVHSELWDGPRTSLDDAPAMFGVDKALPITELTRFLFSHAQSHRDFTLWYDFIRPSQPKVHQTMREFLAEAWNKAWESPRSLIHNLRLIKSPAEIALMKTTCKIASEAITSTIKASHEGITEHRLFAMVDYECRIRGAECLAYPPVVAGGNRANIIHYINNNQVVQPGEMVLMDAGCEFHGYCSDITRTWPISGRFSSTQRALYEAVLSVQTELIQLCSTFPTLDSLFNSMCFLLGDKLKELGVLSKHISENDLARAAYSFCPHHVSHYLGMDVHDTAVITRNIQLKPGMVITVEPGIYVNPNNKLAAPEFHGMGIRIEDDILITENGPIVLTEECPKAVADVESLCSS